MSQKKHLKAFTLIEILVVVAIIALLIAILLPSLARARDQARTTVCLANLKSMGNAFLTYASAHRGALPGNQIDLGDTNSGIKPSSSAAWFGGWVRTPEGNLELRNRGIRALQAGSIYRYMGKDTNAYFCPTDLSVNKEQTGTSYSFASLLSGAKVEMLAGAHYRRAANAMDGNNYTPAKDAGLRGDHRQDMRPLGGAPMVIEESDVTLRQIQNGDWQDYDSLADRHLRGSGQNFGGGNIAYHDGHAELLRVPTLDWANRTAGLKANEWGNRSFIWIQTNSICFRTSTGKWVSGQLFAAGQSDRDKYALGKIAEAPPAEDTTSAGPAFSNARVNVFHR